MLEAEQSIEQLALVKMKARSSARKHTFVFSVNKLFVRKQKEGSTSRGDVSEPGNCFSACFCLELEEKAGAGVY